MRLKIDLGLVQPKVDEKGYDTNIADFSTVVEGTEKDFRDLVTVIVAWLGKAKE